MLDIVKSKINEIDVSLNRFFIFGQKYNKSKKLVFIDKKDNNKRVFIKIARDTSTGTKLKNEIKMIKILEERTRGQDLLFYWPAIFFNGELFYRQVNCYEYLSFPDISSYYGSPDMIKILFQIISEKRKLDTLFFHEETVSKNNVLENFKQNINWFFNSGYSGACVDGNFLDSAYDIDDVKIGFQHRDFIPSNIRYDKKDCKIAFVDLENSDLDGPSVVDFYWLASLLYDQTPDRLVVKELCKMYNDIRRYYFKNPENIDKAELAATRWFIFDILQREGEMMSPSLRKNLLDCLKSRKSLVSFVNSKC